MKPIRILSFAAFYLGEVVRSNLKVASDVLRPTPDISPDWVELEVGDLPRWKLLALANLLTMTPGTLVADVSADGRTLLIHTLYAGAGADTLRREWSRDYVERVRHDL